MKYNSTVLKKINNKVYNISSIVKEGERMKFIPKEAAYIIDTLTAAGYEAYCVGGCVRDLIMGIEANDFDITTSATCEEVKKCFPLDRIIETGIRHGTVTLLINNRPFEVTTYRIESTYSDNRHPDEVVFTRSLSEDLSRRDFTVNSIAFNETDGFVDLFGGREDIERKIIRAVGNPKMRFEEDSLRILRGIRFASTLGFEIESETKKAMLESRHLIKNISAERIFTELSKMLCGKNIKSILTGFAPVIGEIIPEINAMQGFDQHNFHHIYDVLTHTAVVVESTPPVLHLRLAALFHDISKPFCFSLDGDGVGHFYGHPSKSAEIAESRLSELRCDNKTKEAVIRLIRAHDSPIEESERIIKRRLASMGKELFFDLITLKRADTAGLAPEYAVRNAHFDRLEAIANEMLEKDTCFSLKHLAVNGRDMLTLGLKGKEIGTMLDRLLEEVIDGKVENDKQKLTDLAVTLLNK